MELSSVKYVRLRWPTLISALIMRAGVRSQLLRCLYCKYVCVECRASIGPNYVGANQLEKKNTWKTRRSHRSIQSANIFFLFTLSQMAATVIRGALARSKERIMKMAKWPKLQAFAKSECIDLWVGIFFGSVRRMLCGQEHLLTYAIEESKIMRLWLALFFCSVC